MSLGENVQGGNEWRMGKLYLRNFQKEDCAPFFTMPILITFIIKVGQYKCLTNGL